MRFFAYPRLYAALHSQGDMQKKATCCAQLCGVQCMAHPASFIQGWGMDTVLGGAVLKKNDGTHLSPWTRSPGFSIMSASAMSSHKIPIGDT